MGRRLCAWHIRRCFAWLSEKRLFKGKSGTILEKVDGFHDLGLLMTGR